MLLIAKLNNLDTIEKMNGLKVSDKIYLPKSSKVGNVTIANSGNDTNTKNSAEVSIDKLKNIILNDKTVFVEKMYIGYEAENDVYHVYNQHTYNNGYRSEHHPIMSFEKERSTGNIVNISFDDQQKDLLRGKYDYELDEKGNIRNSGVTNNSIIGKMNKNELIELHKILKQKSEGIIRIVS